MEIKDENFNSNELIRADLVINSAGTHLYRIGLCHFEIGKLERNRLNNPSLVAIINGSIFIRSIISILLPEDNTELHIIFGDFSYFYNGSVHFNIAASLLTFMALITQLIHYQNFKKNMKPSYLEPFKMISGLVSPQTIGLSKKEEILKFLKISKRLFVLCEIFTRYAMTMVGFTVSILPLSLNSNTYQIIFYCIPNTILITMCSYYMYSINIWQLIYFYLICYYIKLKLRRINREIMTRSLNKRTINNRNVYYIIKYLTSLYSEIEQYNGIYWSKYLFCVLILFTTIINTILYLTIFAKMILIVKLIFIYGSSIFIGVLLLTIDTASSVNKEASKSHKFLNSYMCAMIVNRFVSIKRRLKVSIV